MSMMSSSGDAHNSARNPRLKCVKKFHDKQHVKKADLTNVETFQSEIIVSKQSVIKHILNARSLQQDSNEVIPTDITSVIQFIPTRQSCFHDDLSRRMLLIGQSTVRKIESLTKSIGYGGKFLASLNSYDYRTLADTIHYFQGMQTVLHVSFSLLRFLYELEYFVISCVGICFPDSFPTLFRIASTKFSFFFSFLCSFLSFIVSDFLCFFPFHFLRFFTS